MKELIYSTYVSLLAKPQFKRFNRFIVTLGLKGLGFDNYENRKRSGEEHFLQWYAKNRLSERVFDVGANEGDYARICLDKGLKTIFCFEPVKNTFTRLEQRFVNHKDVHCFDFGFSDSSGITTIYDKHGTGSSHATLYPETIANREDLIPSTINLETIDHYCKSNQIDRIGLLKIDTEGHELAVLKGAAKMLEQQKIDVIHFEMNRHNICAGNFMKDYLSLLSHYRLYRLLPHAFLPIEYDRAEMDEFFFFQNVIALRRDIFSL
ncbi:MAG: FkbM family methyltransferase [Prolixibacteraceae bacterium]|nr:FkbM family methyltransferase [Prolixibacteraceae bacterium]